METAPTLVKQMENGLRAHPLVNVSKYSTLKLHLPIVVAMGPEY